ncbi:MAG: hypothetical protein ACI9OJ_001694, partial [Myxococcota bacterium]
AALGTLAFGGCAQDLGDVDQVQNNLTQKSELKGEFYFRSTVVAAPYTSVGYFVGDQNYQLYRGVFEIQEKNLFFFRTYEVMIGGDTQGASPDIDTPLYETDDSGKITVDADGNPTPVMYTRRIGDELVQVQRFVYRGAPVVVFPISKHFDVKRQYNPATGEESNVISEDTADRFWNERSYMRVIWGQAGNGTAEHAINPLVSQQTSLPISMPGEFIDETFDADRAPVKVYDEAGETLDYFDYETRIVRAAPEAYAEGYGYIPACWYFPWYLGQVAECNSERITFRHAFMKVKASDYVAWDYDDTLLQKFGYYREERANYDATYGTAYSNVSRRIRRFRIWETYDVAKGNTCESPNGDAKGTCAAGTVCHPFDDGLFCVDGDANERLDYSTMLPKPIVWYISQEFPRDLVSETMQIGRDWDPAFRDVVEFRKNITLKHSELRTDITVPGSQDNKMFIVCENNLAEATAAAATYQCGGAACDINNADHVTELQGKGLLAEVGGFCKDMDSAKRNGDLRYSQIHSVNAPTSVGLYGYGPSSSDPLTGEIFSANSYMYTPAMKRGANNAMIAIEILTGVRNFWETTYANQLKERADKVRLGAASGGLPSYDVASAQAAAATMIDPKVADRITAFGVERTDRDWAADRMGMLARKNPSLARMFITDDVKLLKRDPTVGGDTGETTEELVDRLGIHQWGNYDGNYAKQLKTHGDSHVGGCKFYEEFADNGILGLSREYAAEMNTTVCNAVRDMPNTVFDFSAFETLNGTCNSVGAESEDGQFVCETVTIDDAGTTGNFWANPCSIGKLKVQLVDSIVELELTNPFNTSLDYFPPDPLYTDTQHEVINNSQVAILSVLDPLRDAMIKRLWKRIYLGVAEHEIGHSIGLRHNFEASTDAMNFSQKFWELKGQFNGDTFAPFDLFSGETFYQAANSMRQMQSASVMDYSAKFNDRFDGVGYYDRAAVRFGYGGMVEVFNTNPDLARFADYMADPAVDDPTNLATVHQTGSSDIENMFKRVHYTKIPELFGNLDGIYDRKFVKHADITDGKTADGASEVPYRFCSDELAGRTPTCERWDSGVDSFEIVRNALSDYEAYWPIWGYWHDSVLFQSDIYYNRVVRVFSMTKMQMQWWTTKFQQFNKDDWWKNKHGVAWHEDPVGGLGGSVAIIDTVNVLAQAFGRPQPGAHRYLGATNTFEPVPQQSTGLNTNTKTITQTNCDARGLYPSYDYSGYLPKVTQAGAIYDRLVAYEMLADPTSNFLATDQANDREKYLISYYNLFPDQLSDLYGSMLANKTDGWGWYMVSNNGTPTRCHRRNIVGPQAQNIDQARAEVQAENPNQDVWAFNPEGEYTFPTTRFRIPMLAAYYGLGMFMDAYDHSFADQTRVYLEGHSGAITPAAGADVVSFTDPLSGKTYSAVRGAANADRFNPAVFMIEQMAVERAKYATIEELQENWNYSEYQYIIDKLELLRNMNAVYDYEI